MQPCDHAIVWRDCGDPCRFFSPFAPAPPLHCCRCQECADRGTLSYDLWQLLRCLMRMLAVDTQEIEGLNSVIKHVLGLAPAMGLKLLSSRALIKKTIMWRDHGPQAIDSLATKCAAFHHTALRVHADTSRFPQLLDEERPGHVLQDRSDAPASLAIAPLGSLGSAAAAERRPSMPSIGDGDIGATGATEALFGECFPAELAAPAAPPLPPPQEQPRRRPHKPRCAARIAKIFIETYPGVKPSSRWVIRVDVPGQTVSVGWVVAHTFN